ncbi:ArsR/SmtB family transcription factor [Halarcobacter bivalviorum]|uniref:Transcriptional regulator n=1 Tax=Halarcobacter bivalviorum TaxID=663364 RepID=A0AAX2A8V6_9BACT|nr:metalloregulator ArsR/SmtB family transcription factor [Halarcobacter bivalviorum]AXH12696.1 transcriptional regulator, ArsR family [Halarcobacter bivalviorum]RXK10380.1 transcriptional regulator [Halarcobacter bivalviorum]
MSCCKEKKLIRSCCEDISFISDINKILPSQETLVDISNVFKALADPTRAKILYALIDYEICVGEMTNLLQIPQSHVSHQLRILKKYGIVDFEKDKKMSFYFIKDEYIKELLKLILKEKK